MAFGLRFLSSGSCLELLPWLPSMMNCNSLTYNVEERMGWTFAPSFLQNTPVTKSERSVGL